MAGRPPKPTALKLLQGNPGKRRISKREPRPKLGAEAPTWLSPQAKVFWNHLAPQLVALRVLTEIDAQALAVLCTLLGEFQLQVRRRQVTARMAAEIRAYLGRFGMTPSDRVKVQMVPEGEQDPFDMFLGGKGTQ